MNAIIPAKMSGFLILTLLLCILPVQAFTADSLTIEIEKNGDARIDFEYTLSWLEKMAVYLKVADPGTELKKVLESNFHLPVTIASVSESSARFTISGFASLKNREGKDIVQTPAFSFDMADKILKQYWFAPLVSPDFSPERVTIIYPDMHTEEFHDQVSIPATSHSAVS